MSEGAGGAGRLGVFVAVCCLVFGVNLGRIVFAPLLTPLEVAFGVGPAAVGSLVTVVWVGSAALRVPTGYLLTRVSRHRVVLANGVFLAAAAALTASATSLPLVFLGGFLVGTASGVHFIAAVPLVSELFPDRVGAAIGVHGTASQAAAVLAPLAVPALLTTTDWRAAFWIVAGTALVGTAALLVALRGVSLPEAGTANRDLPAAARARWRLIVTGVAALGAIGFVWNAVFNFYVEYLVTTKGLSEPVAGTMLTLAFAAGVPAFVLTGRLADRVRHVPLLVAIGTTFAAGVLVLTFVRGVVAVAAVSVVVGYAIHSAFPAVDTYLLDSMPDRHRASAYAVYGGVVLLVEAMGGVVLGTLVDRGVPYDTVLRWFVGLIVVVVLVLTLLYRLGWLPRGGRPDPRVGTPVPDGAGSVTDQAGDTDTDAEAGGQAHAAGGADDREGPSEGEV